MKVFYIVLGSFFLSLGFIGVVVPGLPTTPFLLLASGCYVKSSPRLYNWLIHHRTFGRYIREFQSSRSLPAKTKMYSILLMWAMITLSVVFFVPRWWLRAILIAAGLLGTWVMGRIRPRR